MMTTRLTALLTMRQTAKEARLIQGWYTISDVAFLLEMPDYNLRYLIKQGSVPSPGRRRPGFIRKFYNEQDVSEIKELLRIEK